MWIDNIGYELSEGDYVLCLSGELAYTVQKIEKLTKRKEVLGERFMVTLSCKRTLSDYNVILMQALHVTVEDVKNEKREQSGFDVFGNPVNIGDKVLFLHKLEMDAEVGIVSKLTQKSCLLTIKPNRVRQNSYRKPYGEIVSLTALGLNETVINRRFDCYNWRKLVRESK